MFTLLVHVERHFVQLMGTGYMLVLKYTELPPLVGVVHRLDALRAALMWSVDHGCCRLERDYRVRVKPPTVFCWVLAVMRFVAIVCEYTV